MPAHAGIHAFSRPRYHDHPESVLTNGRKDPPAGQGAGLVYSRFNQPNSEIVEDRLVIYERAEKGVLFSSGMSAIATTLLAFVKPGDAILHSQPLYGGIANPQDLIADLSTALQS